VPVVHLLDIWTMLDQCAPGHVRKQGKHHWIVSYGDKTYHALPLGPHGRRVNPEIETGYVRSLARHLGIEECARTHLALG
jgi:hypothetical protein